MLQFVIPYEIVFWFYLGVSCYISNLNFRYANLPIPESLASKSTRIGILGNEFLILNGFFIFIFKVSFTGSENFFFFLDGELDKDAAPLFDE